MEKGVRGGGGNFDDGGVRENLLLLFFSLSSDFEPPPDSETFALPLPLSWPFGTRTRTMSTEIVP